MSVAALFVVLDAGRPRASTRHLLRGVERAVLGRSGEANAKRESATLRLGLPDPHLSVEHAVVERSLGGWQVRDLGSKNGLSVNGERLAHKVLEDGDWIEIGETFLRFRTLKVSPSTLAAATLFGHRRGAYTGASDDRPGAIRTAHRGTLLRDEIADLPLATQGTLLRVLQEREVVPVGETAPVPLAVRFIAATHKDLEREVEAGRFRVDLYARLAGLRATLPPLRHRIVDHGTLVAAALARHAPSAHLGLSPAAAWAMCRDRWPLNIRALDQALAAASAVAPGARLTLAHLPEQVASRAPAAAVEVARREELIQLLRTHRGNLAAVARALDTSRAQIHRLLRRFDLDPDAYRRTG